MHRARMLHMHELEEDALPSNKSCVANQGLRPCRLRRKGHTRPVQAQRSA